MALSPQHLRPASDTLNQGSTGRPNLEWPVTEAISSELLRNGDTFAKLPLEQEGVLWYARRQYPDEFKAGGFGAFVSSGHR